MRHYSSLAGSGMHRHPQSGCTNEDIAERGAMQAEQQSRRKVNEAAEVTLSSMLLIAVFEGESGNTDV